MAQTRHLVLGLMPRGADPDTHWAAGPWCFDTEEDFFPGWEDSFVFGREPLRDPATLDRAVLMAQSLTVDSIPALGRHLLDLQRRRAEENNPVSTLLGPDEIDLPGVYWETLLTPWACTVARQLVERWLRVRAMVEDWGHLPLHVELLPEDCAFSFATEHDFVMSGALGADWNTWLMSRLLEAVWPERWTRSYALPVCASYGRLIPPEDSGSLKQRLRAWARSCVLRLPCPPLRGMRLHQALRYSLALLHPSRQSDASRPLAAHFGSAATGVEHDLPLDPLPIFIGALPQTLAELDHPDHVAPARVPRVRVASVRAHEDTHYRQKLALWRARGHRVMFVQHGGNVGQVRLCSGPLEARMLTCALMVLDHHGTTLLQALAANVPTIAYWDRSIWPMTDEALARLDLLAEAGIWQPSAEAAAAKVREVWDNPARWWLDERVQSARRAFCREHAFVDPKGPNAHIVSLLQRL